MLSTGADSPDSRSALLGVHSYVPGPGGHCMYVLGSEYDAAGNWLRDFHCWREEGTMIPTGYVGWRFVWERVEFKRLHHE